MKLHRTETEVLTVARRTYERDAHVLRALANESRLMIVERLSAGEACVCELTEMLGLDQSTVSKHLAVLKTAAVVNGTRRGNHIYYRLLAPCVLSFLNCAASVGRDGNDTETCVERCDVEAV
jgi:DNA-binding transcriptional ArsR family regulator